MFQTEKVTMGRRIYPEIRLTSAQTETTWTPIIPEYGNVERGLGAQTTLKFICH